MSKQLTVENILFFADQKKAFNLGVNQHSTNLTMKVSKLVGEGSLVEVARDDADIYYKITPKGKIKLLRLQIAWRMENGKDYSRHAAELEELLHATKTDTAHQATPPDQTAYHGEEAQDF